MKAQILNNRKRRPTHPGELLREEILPALGITQGELARRLDVSRQTINEVVAEKRSMSIDLAYRFGRLFNMDGSTFVRMQEAVDVWDTLQTHGEEYDRIKPLAKSEGSSRYATAEESDGAAKRILRQRRRVMDRM